MSRDFSKVSPKVWRSPRFRGLQVEQKLFYVYVLTCEHQSSAGCFRLPDAYAAADLGWNEQELEKARAALITAELLVHDPATEEYFVPRWFKHNPGTNPKHRSGIVRIISELDSDHVREAAEAEYAATVPEPNPLDSGSVLPIGNASRLANSSYMRGRQ
jgi:hypothetical protein